MERRRDLRRKIEDEKRAKSLIIRTLYKYTNINKRRMKNHPILYETNPPTIYSVCVWEDGVGAGPSRLSALGGSHAQHNHTILGPCTMPGGYHYLILA